MARASTTLAHAPIACTTRQLTNVPALPESAQRRPEPMMNSTRPTADRPTAAIAVADRAPEQLAKAEADQVARDRQPG